MLYSIENQVKRRLQISHQEIPDLICSHILASVVKLDMKFGKKIGLSGLIHAMNLLLSHTDITSGKWGKQGQRKALWDKFGWCQEEITWQN